MSDDDAAADVVVAVVMKATYMAYSCIEKIDDVEICAL